MISEIVFLVTVYLTIKHGVKFIVKTYGLLFLILTFFIVSLGPLIALFLIPLISRAIQVFVFALFTGWLFRFIVERAKE